MRNILTCAAATAVALSLAAPAHAYAESAQYTLRVVDETTGESSLAALECDPAGGTHPRAEEACEAIEEAGGSIAEVDSSGAPCTMIYQPVTVTSTGYEEYEETFGNACVLDTTKGAVFDF
ncbi:SSI family serine proteinase inhibitor [Nocardiopsis nanhaiensis]